MKKEYSSENTPPALQGMETYGFSWMEFVTSIPAPLFLVTTSKANGKANACLQSWACFSSESGALYAILASVNKAGHLYQTVKETGVAVLNFPSASIYDSCLRTIQHNGWEDDEIARAGLTAEPAATVHAPRVKECFLNLEARLAWERDIAEGGKHALLCLEITHIAMEEAHMDEAAQGRYGEGGYLYNVHYPVNPETYGGKAADYIAVLQKLRSTGEY